jgi:hypothetical protein
MMAVQLSDDSIGKSARRQQIIDGLHDIPGQIKRVLDQDKEFQSLAKDMLGEKSLLIMGRGYQCACTISLIIILGRTAGYLSLGTERMCGESKLRYRCHLFGGCVEDQGSVVHAL